jgi:ubiquinone/menaquinone biosynthesis C-methylase UbiE
MNYENNPKSIKYHVKKYFLKHAEAYKNKNVIDFPAGNGITTQILQEIGAIPHPYDLFPQYFKLKNIACNKADIHKDIPYPHGMADALICQEGLEHFSDQLHALKQFNKVLKINGELIITTPNYSNLSSRISYMLMETEKYNKLMPPNEIDSIWMNAENNTDEIYYGHIFLLGIQKLRILSVLAGFRIKKIIYTRKKVSSLILLPFWYPWIYLSSLYTYKKNMRKNNHADNTLKQNVYSEQFKLATNIGLLLDSHLFIIFEKVSELNELSASLKSVHKGFGTT